MADRPGLDGARRSRERAPAWQQATICAVIDEAPDAVTLRLRLREASGFLPGQYYNVRLPVPGRPLPVQRAYSVGSSPMPDPSLIDLGVRELPGSLGEALECLASDHDFLAPAFSDSVLETYREIKREEQLQLNLRPHPYEFYRYLDV